MICKFLKTCWEWNWNLHIFFPLHPKITSSFHLLFFFLFDAKRNLIYDRSISIWVTRELDIFMKKKTSWVKCHFQFQFQKNLIENISNCLKTQHYNYILELKTVLHTIILKQRCYTHKHNTCSQTQLNTNNTHKSHTDTKIHKKYINNCTCRIHT